MTMRHILANRFTILLATLLAFILMVPPVVEHMRSSAVVPWALSVIVIAIVLATLEGRGWLLHSLLLIVALAALITMWTCQCVAGIDTIKVVDGALFSILLLSACGRIGHHLAKQKHVNRETLAAAVGVYVLFGMAMTRIYWLLFMVSPGAFHFTEPVTNLPMLPSFLYYSFVVMTTVGFGDILPVTALARSLTILHSIISVFYLAITISRLVSLYRSKDAAPE